MNIKSRLSNFATITGMVLSLLGATAIAAPANNDHDHGDGVAELRLDNGSKWAIDAPLSRAMTNIRNAVDKDYEAIHSNQLAGEKYAALATKVTNEVAYMVENCNLEPEADAQLHLIIVDLMEGSTAMESKANAQDGAVKVIGAIGKYITYFNDPDFKPIKH
ncbi:MULTISPECIES: hypothetical protein [unclassified Marinobacter]|uniref:hypothetical protein n=1 Tax=unclassified Marinobacter TaxID=83889 RepID=UPI000BF80A20|nr:MULTISPECIES: hypothetical protein [unclassified Marinobacter]PFG11347.1 hypothetical protein ATI45_3860 [Marinobacter sp. LV10MA510-1]PFG53185.1 hypothetical protein ATG98_2268 [Marinobacter sp. LV10R520-4]